MLNDILTLKLKLFNLIGVASTTLSPNFLKIVGLCIVFLVPIPINKMGPLNESIIILLKLVLPCFIMLRSEERRVGKECA